MMHRAGGTRWIPILAAAALLGACGDSTDVVTDYDPQETLDHLDTLVDGLDLGEGAFWGMYNAADYFYAFGAAPVADALRMTGTGLVRRSLPEAETLRSLAEHRLATAARTGADAALPKLAFPSVVLGETLVWDPTQGYVVDQGAPAGTPPTNGVRVIYYSVDGEGYPTTPLAPLGYIDLTDEDGTVAERVGVRVVEFGSSASQDREVADYGVEMTLNGSSSAGSLRLDLSGDLFDGPDVVEVDMVDQFTWSSAENYDRLVSDYRFETEDGPVTFAFEAESAFEAAEWEAIDLEIGFGTTGADAVQLILDIDSLGRLSGELRRGGTPVIDIAGTDGNPEFTGRGDPLTSSQISTLESIWIGISDVLTLADWLMEPSALLYLPN